MKKILIAGESWVKHISHIKGFDIFTSCEYETGVTWLRDALEAKGFVVVHMPGHEVADFFPFTPEDLGKYAAVVLSDIGANTLLLSGKVFAGGERTPNRCQSIKQYVANGGGFCMIGGYLSFAGIDGKARYAETAINDILPVEIMVRDDRVERPDGVIPKVVDPSHPVLAGLPLEWPHFLGYNRLLARPEGKIVVTIDGDPFIAVRDYGGGRTAAFASDAAPHWGPKEFVTWKHYPDFWGNLFTWLTEGTKAP